MFASLIALDGFHLLLSTHLTADLTPGESDGFMIHPLPYIYAKTLFCSVETVANNTLNRRSVAFDRLETNVTPTLNTAFSLANVYAKWWIHCLRVSSFSLLSHTTYGRPNQIGGVFGVFRDKCRISATWAFSIICICTTAFKVSIALLNLCFWWSWIRMTLIKPLLCLNSIFLIRKQCFIKRTNSDFWIVLKICNSSFT